MSFVMDQHQNLLVNISLFNKENGTSILSFIFDYNYKYILIIHTIVIF